MSFVFPKPANSKSINGSSVSDRELTTNSEPDYDLLLVRLSLYVFNRLSPSVQRETVEEISHTVNVEDVQFLEKSDEAFRLRTFSQLFKKLRFSDQLELFLSKVIQKFKRERQLGELISSFKKLDADLQQQLIDQIVHGTPENLRNPEETEEEFRLRRFTWLSGDYTSHVYKRFVAWKEPGISEEPQVVFDIENGSKWKSRFAEFFLGFSIIWFQGQISKRQDMLIEQLAKGVKGVVIAKRLPDESVEDFKLRRFTELCKKVVDFKVQEKFLEIAEKKLTDWGSDESWRMIVEPQDSGSVKCGAELLFHLSTFGLTLLSAKFQEQKIDEMSNQVKDFFLMNNQVKDVNIKRRIVEAQDQTSSEQEEDCRVRKFKELFSQVPISTRLYIFQEIRKILSQQKRYDGSIRLFRGLGSEDQTEIVESMFDQIINSSKWDEKNPAEVIVEKFSGESEEDFRLRRFKKLCIHHMSTKKVDISWPVNVELLSGSDDEDCSPYAEFLFGEAIIWFKARCANYVRNPIERILYGKIEFGDVIDKLPEESEEEFRLRRFTESLKPLELTSLECIHDYIEERLMFDIGHPVPMFPIERSSGIRRMFDPEFVKVRLPGGASTKQVEHATSQPFVG